MYDIYDNDFDKAFDEAVDAIERNAKKKHGRLIDADALKEYVREQINLPLPKDRLYMVVPIEDFITNLIDNAPTIEAEPIVRCKDCKWFGLVGCAVLIVDDYDKPTENDFCSFAERR